jgi:GntR family transcriptional regulator, transcriptional repressor for pyruvate dehydrogenase complex
MSMQPKLPAGRSRADIIYKTLLDRIYAGQYAKHSRLPTERDLTEEFGVSRPLVRNALARLREGGLIRSVQGSGSIVLHDTTVDGSAPQDRSSVGELQRCFEFRVLIEGEAAFLAARRCDLRSLELIRQNVELVKHHVEKGEYRIGESFDFHRAVAQASDNPFIVQALDRITDFIGFKIYMSRSMLLPKPVDRLAMINKEHSAILSHIEMREAEEARALMRSHIERARDLFLECLPLDLKDMPIIDPR